MIDYISGRLALKTPTHVRIEVGGIGYGISIPLSTYEKLPEAGSKTELYTFLHVREDCLQLFGFKTAEEKDFFAMLISVSGVGPRLALAILSGIGVDELCAAVERQDGPRLQNIPGVGRKTAQRVLLELRDKMAGSVSSKKGGEEAGPATWDGAEEDGTRGDAVSALMNLGYARDKAARAVDGALAGLGQEPALEQLLKSALGRLVR